MKSLSRALFVAVAVGLCAMHVSADGEDGGFRCAQMCKDDVHVCMPQCNKHGKDFDMQCHGYCKYNPFDYEPCYDKCCNNKKEHEDFLVVCKAKCEVHIDDDNEYSFCIIACQQFGNDWDQDCYNQCDGNKNEYDGCYNSCCDKKKNIIVVEKPTLCQQKCKQDWIKDFDGCCNHCEQHQDEWDMCCYKQCCGYYGVFDSCYEDCYWQRNCNNFCGPPNKPDERCKSCKPEGPKGPDSKGPEGKGPDGKGFDNKDSCDNFVYGGGSRRMMV